MEKHIQAIQKEIENLLVDQGFKFCSIDIKIGINIIIEAWVTFDNEKERDAFKEMNLTRLGWNHKTVNNYFGYIFRMF